MGVRVPSAAQYLRMVVSFGFDALRFQGSLRAFYFYSLAKKRYLCFLLGV